MSDNNQFEKEIAVAEEGFIKLGAKRMSDFFGVKNFKNRINSQNVLWLNGNTGYYHVKAKKYKRKVWIVVQYSVEMDKGFEDYSEFEYTDDENRITECINNVIHGILPEQEKILNMYIDTDDKPFEPDYTAIKDEFQMDGGINVSLITIMDPGQAAEVMADRTWNSLKEKRPTGSEEDFADLTKLEDAFINYWTAENFDKALEVALKIKEIATVSFFEDRYMVLLGNLYEVIGLYLKEDFISAMKYGERLVSEADDSDNLIVILIMAYEYLASTYYALGYREKAVDAAGEYLKYSTAYYGADSDEAIKAKLKYDLYKGIDSSPRKAIQEADAVYKRFLASEGKQGCNTILALDNLCHLLAMAGDYNQALMADAKKYRTYELKYGRDDQLTLYALLDLANDVAHLSDGFNNAEALAKYAYDRAVLKYGDKSQEAALALLERAAIYRRFGAMGKAFFAEEKRYHIIKEIYGPDHIETIREKESFADAYREFSEYIDGSESLENALKLDQEAFEWRKKVFGANDKFTIKTEEMMIHDLYELGKKQEALDMQMQLISRCEETFGSEDRFCVERYKSVSYMESDMKWYEKALSTDLYILKQYKRIFDEAHPHMLVAVENIIRDLKDLKRYDDALQYAYQEIARRIELLGERNERTQDLIEMYLSLKAEKETVVHYFRYHVPNFMGFDVRNEETGFVVYYKEFDNNYGENSNKVDISEEKVEELIEILKPSLSWKEKYEGEGSFYGEGFELELYYGDIEIKSGGKFAYPENYEELHAQVLSWINQVVA